MRNEIIKSLLLDKIKRYVIGPLSTRIWIALFTQTLLHKFPRVYVLVQMQIAFDSAFCWYPVKVIEQE